MRGHSAVEIRLRCVHSDWVAGWCDWDGTVMRYYTSGVVMVRLRYFLKSLNVDMMRLRCLLNFGVLGKYGWDRFPTIDLLPWWYCGGAIGRSGCILEPLGIGNTPNPCHRFLEPWKMADLKRGIFSCRDLFLLSSTNGNRASLSLGLCHVYDRRFEGARLKFNKVYAG